MAASMTCLCRWLIACVSAGSAFAIADDFPAVYNSEKDKSLQPMDPAEAASKMKLPTGFRASLFAAEPDVQNPIAMNWDARGRLWVAENYTYSERAKRFDLSLRDRVVVFEDKNNDGKSDTRHVFHDQLQMLTSVEIGRGGVWLMCPPNLLFVPDANEDAIPDGPAKVVLDGFFVAQDNYHNFANGLKWGPDGWLYGRCGHSCPGNVGVPNAPLQQRVPIDGGIWRYHPERAVFEVLCHGTTNPWGHDWDRNGELFFVNTVIGHLWHMMPGAHLKESFGESMNPSVYERLDMIADHYHFDTKGNWSDGRDGKANEFGGGHAHIGATICSAKHWPNEYQGRLFTLNMHGLRANVERLERFGAGFAGRHEPDFLIAQDPFFRGMDLNFGPDGNMFVIDWSDTGECHEQTGVHRTSGRIFKISYGDAQQPAPIAKPACIAGDGVLQTMWREFRTGQITRDALKKKLLHDDEGVRAWAIRLLSDAWPLDTIVGPSPHATYPQEHETLREFDQLARNDPSSLVHLVLASTLQRMPVESRSQLAMSLVKHARYANDRDLPMLVWFGLIPVADTDPSGLIEVAKASEWPSLVRWIARRIGSECEKQPKELESLLNSTATRPDAIREQVLRGMLEAFRGRQKVTQPSAWDAYVKGSMSTLYPEMVRELGTVFGNGRAMDEIRNIVKDNKADMKIRQRALTTLIEARPDDLRELCESLLDVRVLNGTALQGLSLSHDPSIAEKIARKYKRFQPEDRPRVIEVLVSRVAFANAILDVLDSKDNPIALTDITPFHVRQLRSLGDTTLNARIAKSWGELRDSPAEKQAAIATEKQMLSPEVLAKADLAAGRALFEKTCSQCHTLYGSGAKIGPDLTGSQRSNLDYLLENILDPSAVVGKDYRMTLVQTNDGRTLSGLVVSNDGKVLVLQTQTTKETIAFSEIDQMKETNLSSMPDGLLNGLSRDQVRDLIGYLMHPNQIATKATGE